jgi:head-tail adaptor
MAELDRAQKWPAMNSAHEGFAVLAEEVDELWEHVKTRQDKRDLEATLKEATQVAAMAVRFMMDVCNADRIRR